jgi:hypothetical protein
MENYKYNYVFNETELTGSSRLMIYHPSNATRGYSIGLVFSWTNVVPAAPAHVEELEPPPSPP